MTTIRVDSTTSPPTIEMVIPRNAHWDEVWRWKDGNGDPIDVSGRSYKVQLRRDPAGDLEVEVNVDMAYSDSDTQFTGADAGNDQVRFHLAPSDTADADPAPHAIDIQETDNAGQQYPIARGTAYLQAEVTS